MFAQRFKITHGLGTHQHSEGIRLAGNPGVLGNVKGQQKEKALVRPAFMKLPGRVQVTRTIADCRRDSHPVSHKRTNPPQPALINFIFVDIGQDGQIITPAAACLKNNDNA